MKRKIKKNKIQRYLNVFRRRVRRLTRKKVYSWIKANLSQHPFIVGILFFIWVDNILISRNYGKDNIPGFLKFNFYVIASWLILAVVSNLLKDKTGVKWYLRKRFVLFTLILATPVGLILLWSGARFKRVTKTILTAAFISLFIFMQVYYNRKYEKFVNKKPVERILETISRPKKKTYLKTIDSGLLDSLRLSTLTKRAKVKLAASDIASRCSPATVSIKTKDKDGEEIGIGSGFVISSNGIIVTNFHVLQSAYQAEVKIGQEEYKDTLLIKSDPGLDIALLKIDAGDLAVLPIGDSEGLIDGQFIVVLGNPWGFERSVSSGIISGIRSKGDFKLIQMTAPVSPGSSGGPVINEYGEVIGITTVASFLLAQNLNFAIPIDNLKKLLSEK